MNFCDTINMTDSIVHGFVILKDQNGSIIFKKNNMVVRSGRDAIFNKICKSFNDAFKSLTEKDENPLEIDRYSINTNYDSYSSDSGNKQSSNVFSHFSKIAFGNNNKMTTMDTTTISEIVNNTDASDSLYTIYIDTADNDDVNIKPQLTVSFENTESYRCIVFEITLTATESAELTELGLFYKPEGSDDASSERLFSRVVFDPIFCGPNAAITELNLNYYLYF